MLKEHYRHFCLCGCGGKIEIKSYHKLKGFVIPRYIHGHHRRGTNGWNKGLTKETHPGIARQSEKMKGRPSWNAGLTKETDCRVAENAKALVGVKHGVAWNKGLTKETYPNLAHSEEQKKKCGDKTRGKTHKEIYGDNSERIKQCIRNSLLGEKSPNWNGGSSYLPYSTDWTDDLRECIRKRDGNVCQLCGKTQEENKRRMAVHHIDYIKEHCDPENLITLCNKCNSKVNSGRKTWTRFFRLRLKLKRA